MSKYTKDKKRKEIIADFAICKNYSEVARKHGCAPNTVKNIVNHDRAFANLCEQKSEEIERDIFAHMDSRKNMVCRMVDLYLEALQDKEKIKKATPSQLSTALGIVLDKFTAARDRDTGEAVVIVDDFDKIK